MVRSVRSDIGESHERTLQKGNQEFFRSGFVEISNNYLNSAELVNTVLVTTPYWIYNRHLGMFGLTPTGSNWGLDSVITNKYIFCTHLKMFFCDQYLIRYQLNTVIFSEKTGFWEKFGLKELI